MLSYIFVDGYIPNCKMVKRSVDRYDKRNLFLTELDIFSIPSLEVILTLPWRSISFFLGKMFPSLEVIFFHFHLLSKLESWFQKVLHDKKFFLAYVAKISVEFILSAWNHHHYQYDDML